MAVREELISLHGCQLRVMRKGRGDRLVYLHGAGGASAWTPFFDALAAHFEVMVPEHPGFGSSPRPVWLESAADWAYFYLDYLALLKGKVHLAGNSLGAWIAAEMAIRDCARLRTLSLISAAGLQLADVAPGPLFDWTPEEAARNLFASPDLVAPYLAQVATLEASVRRNNQATLERVGRESMLANPGLRKWLGRVRVPTLIVWGDRDRLFPLSYASAYHNAISGSRLEVIEDCGHLPHIEKRTRVVELLTQFCSGPMVVPYP